MLTAVTAAAGTPAAGGAESGGVVQLVSLTVQ